MQLQPLCRIILVASLLAPAFSWSCAHVQPVISIVKDCADEVTHKVTAGILDDVASIVACDGSNAAALPACVVAQLIALAKTAGWAAIDCALAEVNHSAARKMEDSNDLTVYLLVRRSQAAIAWRAGPDGGSGTAPAGAP